MFAKENVLSEFRRLETLKTTELSKILKLSGPKLLGFDKRRFIV